MPREHGWRIVVMLACAGALNYADRTAISSVFPLLAEEFQLSNIQLASIGSMFLWSYAACSPVAGLIADRVSARLEPRHHLDGPGA
jgi:sugar phosphate permease